MERKVESIDFPDFLAGAVSSRGRPVGPEPTFAGRLFTGYQSVVDWFLESKCSPSWQKNCTRYLTEYCHFVGKDPDTLLAERKARLRADPDDRTDERQLARWHQKLLQEYAPGTALVKYTAIVSFFKWNNKKLNIAKFPTVGPEHRREFRRLRKEEIQKLLSFANNYRTKTMLLVGPESGLRAHHLQMLELGHLVVHEDGSREGVTATNWQDLTNATPPVRIQLPKKCYFGRKKAGITFLCKDAVSTIIEAMKMRESHGESIGSRTPLFPTYSASVRVVTTGRVSVSYLSEWHSVGGRVPVRHPQLQGNGRGFRPVEAIVEKMTVRHVTEQTMEYDMRILRRKAGTTYNPEEERPVNLHSLRKYLRSTLDASGVNSIVANVIIGHSNAVEEHYSGARHLDIEEIRLAYQSAMHRIAITEDNGPRVSKLETKVRELETYNRTLEERLSEYGSVRDRLEDLQRQVQELLGQKKTP